VNSNKRVPRLPEGRLTSGKDRPACRRARRETVNREAPDVTRRPRGSSDRRLRQPFNGERGLPFLCLTRT
jgi:hypothetical protein